MEEMEQMMIIMIFVLFVLYTLACVADGQDVKPIWKRWLSYPRLYREAQDEITCLRNQLMTKPIPVEHIPFISEMVESNIYIPESEIAECMRHEEMARMYGGKKSVMLIPPRYRFDHLLQENIERSKQELFKEINGRDLIDVDIDKESYYPAIIIRSSIVVGKTK